MGYQNLARTSGIELRPIEDKEIEAFRRVGAVAFGRPHDAAGSDQWRARVDLERTVGAFADGELVGTALAHSFLVSVPGGEARAAGVGDVTVLPTHRRRGILRALMRHQLDDFHARAEPLACLWPSEAAIYGRFGYGPAWPALHWEADTRDVAFLPEVVETTTAPGLEVRLLGAEEARPALEQVYEGVRRRTPGMLQRTSVWWDAVLGDREGSMLRAVATDGDRPVAYALYTVKASWGSSGPENRIDVRELACDSPRGAAAVWSYLFSVDLVRTVACWNRPGDDPLPWMVRNRRALQRRAGEGLWVRLVDLPAAIAARRYRADATVVVEIHDSACPWNEGRWRLDLGPEGGGAERTTGDPEVVVETAHLASAYLGGFGLGALAGAGLVAERVDGAVAALDRAMAWDPAPWTPSYF